MKRGLDLFEIRAVDTNAVPLILGATRFRWLGQLDTDRLVSREGAESADLPPHRKA
jgi:hypothetical protein